MEHIEADGASIPALGFGTWELWGEEAEGMVGRPLELGYRHIDTAQSYGNEERVGRAIERSGLPRSELKVECPNLDGSTSASDTVRKTGPGADP